MLALVLSPYDTGQMTPCRRARTIALARNRLLGYRGLPVRIVRCGDAERFRLRDWDTTGAADNVLRLRQQSRTHRIVN